MEHRATLLKVMLLAGHLQNLIALPCTPPANIESAKRAVIDYYTSGQFDLECEGVIDKALQYFVAHDTTFNANKTVIFDIDETALSNFEHFSSVEFCRNCYAQMRQELPIKSPIPAIPAVKRLYDFLVERSYHIIFLTNRRHAHYEVTYNNLIVAGYHTFDRLITKEEIYKHLSPQEFKAQQRALLVNAGFDIVASVGDMPGDFVGGNTGYHVRIPNYLYEGRY